MSRIARHAIPALAALLLAQFAAAANAQVLVKDVRVGDTVTIRMDGRDRVLEVTQVIDKRVGAPLAAASYADHSPPPPPPEASAPFLVRDRSAGRPTKRDRRQIERLRQR